jgi:hypothetical protein
MPTLIVVVVLTVWTQLVLRPLLHPLAPLVDYRQRATERSRSMNLLILLLVLLLIFGGGGFYYGGPHIGYSFGGIILLILVILLITGRFKIES